MAPTDSFCSQPQTFEWPMFLNGYHHIITAGGGVPARTRKVGRQNIFIGLNEKNQDEFDHFKVDSKESRN